LVRGKLDPQTDNLDPRNITHVEEDTY